MAIPGFQQYYNMTYDESVYYNYVAYMVGIVKDKQADVVSVVEEVRQQLIQNRAPNILLENGYVDVWKIKSPTVQDLLERGFRIVDYGEINGHVAAGFIEGQFTIFYNEAADDYSTQMSIPIPQQLSSPKLYISSANGLLLGEQPPMPVIPHVFVATFITKWGESSPSNMATAYSQEDSQNWSVVLEIEGEYIPSYATSVKYYKWFDNIFRVIDEVKI